MCSFTKDSAQSSKNTHLQFLIFRWKIQKEHTVVNAEGNIFCTLNHVTRTLQSTDEKWEKKGGGSPAL
jgi:hypothetical protein